jgi:hypothetical protein
MEAMTKKIAAAIGVETAMICRSCKHISHTNGEPAIGRAAAYTCGFCGHRHSSPPPPGHNRQGARAGWTALRAARSR